MVTTIHQYRATTVWWMSSRRRSNTQVHAVPGSYIQQAMVLKPAGSNFLQTWISFCIIYHFVYLYKKISVALHCFYQTGSSFQACMRYLCVGLEVVRLLPAGLLGDIVVVVRPSIWRLVLRPHTLITQQYFTLLTTPLVSLCTWESVPASQQHFSYIWH